jgi:hypothetical protein
MENAQIAVVFKENAGPTKSALVPVDPAMRKSFDKLNSSAIVTSSLPAALELCGASLEVVFTSDVLLENRAPKPKTPIPGGLLQKKMPFGERNMEEGRRLLPPYIKVPPKKLFGYPERSVFLRLSVDQRNKLKRVLLP